MHSAKDLADARIRRTEEKSRSRHQVTETNWHATVKMVWIYHVILSHKKLDFNPLIPPLKALMWTENWLNMGCWVSKFSGSRERGKQSCHSKSSSFYQNELRLSFVAVWCGPALLGKIVLKGCWTPNSCPASKSAHKGQTNCISNFLPSLVTGRCGRAAHYKARFWPRKIRVPV